MIRALLIFIALLSADPSGAQMTHPNKAQLEAEATTVFNRVDRKQKAWINGGSQRRPIQVTEPTPTDGTTVSAARGSTPTDRQVGPASLGFRRGALSRCAFTVDVHQDTSGWAYTTHCTIKRGGRLWRLSRSTGKAAPSLPTGWYEVVAPQTP